MCFTVLYTLYSLLYILLSIATAKRSVGHQLIFLFRKLIVPKHVFYKRPFSDATLSRSHIPTAESVWLGLGFIQLLYIIYYVRVYSRFDCCVHKNNNYTLMFGAMVYTNIILYTL